MLGCITKGPEDEGYKNQMTEGNVIGLESNFLFIFSSVLRVALHTVQSFSESDFV